MTMTRALTEQGWKAEAERVAAAVRRRVLEHTVKNNGGYLSQACSAADILAALYTRVMRLGPSEGAPLPPAFAGVPGPHNRNYVSGGLYNGAKAPDLDRFFFSPAHYALVLYATLIEVGRMAPEALEQFNADGSTVEMIGAEHSPGVETTTGSLGQALSQAGGVALARKLKGETGRVWVFMSDGELQEGQTWEAFSALAHYRLDNLGIFFDVNGQQCDGTVESVMTIEPIRERLESFGAAVHEVDGHDLDALVAPTIHPQAGKPLVVLARTDPCYTMPILRARAPRLHYVRFKNAEERETYRRLVDETKMPQEVA